MDFEGRIREIASRVESARPHLKTEEATKNALVMPFLQALGYNPFDPAEVVPEFTADLGTKKKEKVDYAVMRDGEPIMLVECKCHEGRLEDLESNQLFRYFSATNARIGVLTDGVRYRFFSDLEKPNLMDKKPFMEFDLSDIENPLIPEIQKLCKEHWDLDATISAASELKYTRQIRKLLAQEYHEPSEIFVRHFASQVYPGKLTQSVKEQFTSLVRRAFRQFVNDSLTERLKTAMNVNDPDSVEDETPSIETPSDGIITTEEEIEGYLIIKAILCKSIDPSRVTMRDTKSYCGVLLDDNNRKPICRLRFNTANKYLGIIMDADKKEEKLPLENLDDIYKHAEAIKAAAALWDEDGG